MRLRLLAIGLIWLVTVGATFTCSSGDGFEFDDHGPSFVTELTLRDAAGTARDRFQRGEPVTLELAVRNRRNSDVAVQFPSSRQSDFIVVNSGTRTLRWKWSNGRAFTQAVTEIVFGPDETRRFLVTWNQTDDTGQPLPLGRYEARGVMVYPQFDSEPTSTHEFGSSLRPFSID